MAHGNDSINSRTNLPSPRPQVPSISVPSDEHGRTSTLTTNDTRASEPPQTPNNLQQPRSRRGSFSFLRRSRSREYPEPNRESGSHRKLSRRKTNRVVSQEEVANQIKMPPQLPSYHNLPQMAPFNDAPVSAPAQPSVTSNAQPSTFSNNSERPASKRGYDPNAFYRRHLGMTDRTTPTKSSREATPTAAGSSPPSAYQDPYNRTDRYVSVPEVGSTIPLWS